MLLRILGLSVALFIGIGIIIPLSTHNSEAGAPKAKTYNKKAKKYKKYSKKWWRLYRHRLRNKKALEARKRTLRLRQIQLAKARKSSLIVNAQNNAPATPAILINNLFILVEGKVKDVFDGETFNIETGDGKFYLVRMLGIDAPEINQDFGNESWKRLSSLILGKKATVIIRRRDLSGRFLGTVYSGGEDINLLQLESGMASYFRQIGYEPTGIDRKLYQRAQQKAMSSRTGLWIKPKASTVLALK